MTEVNVMPTWNPRANELFAKALELADATARAAFLAREAGDDAELRRQTMAMLAAHDRAGDFLVEPHPDAVDGLRTSAYPSAATRPDLSNGSIFAGRYKVREKLGEGGMGTVYVADQSEPVQRRVALKIIKADVSSERLMARFEQERQALALMDHPNIAKVLDAGVTETMPYFVMELIKGVPITQYCDDAKLTPKQRLELFIPICRAVQHAHQKGLVHRDLKPSNILIGLYDGRPVPKVIDFGVAKATGAKLTDQSIYTEVGALIGTLEYMSPEQAELNNLDIDTRSDIYALGVVLYELLTGVVPLSRKELKIAGYVEMLRIIKEVEPPKPSTRLSGSGSLPSIAASRQMEPKRLMTMLRNDLDWIVMKALEKDRSRRYETANGFALDIQRYLADEPVLAGPPSAAYRFRKFVKRNRPQVLAATVAVLALLGGIGGTTFGLLHAEKQRGIAEARERDAALAAFEERQAKEREVAQRAVAVEQRAKAEKARDRTREVLDAMVSEATGDSLTAQTAIGEEQKKFLQGVLGYYRDFAGEKADDELSRSRHAKAAIRLGVIEHRLGRKSEAAAAFRIARDSYASLAADFPTVPAYRQELARSHSNLGGMLELLGDRTEAEIQHRKGLSIQEQLSADFSTVPAYRQDLARGHTNLGILLAGAERRPEANEQFRKALSIIEKLAADFPAVHTYRQELASSHNNLGALLATLGSPEAEEQYRTALTIQEKLADELHSVPAHRQGLAKSHNNLGLLLVGLGKKPEAEEEYRKALSIQEKLAADFPAAPPYRWELARYRHNLGNVLQSLRRSVEAEIELRQAAAIQERLCAEFPAVPTYRQELALSLYNLANVTWGLQKQDEAGRQYRRALAIREKLVVDFPTVTSYRLDLALTVEALGKLAVNSNKATEAEDYYRKAVSIREKLAADFPAVPTYRQDFARTLLSLAYSCRRSGKRPEAEELFRKCVSIREKLVADFPGMAEHQIDLGGTYVDYGHLVRDGGKPAESLEWFEKAIRILAPALEKNPRGVSAKHFLRNGYLGRAKAREREQKFADAVEDWGRAIELSPPTEQPGLRAKRILARVQSGQVAEAVAETAELSKLPGWNRVQLYDFACVYSIASGKIADKKREYADRAMEFLRQAVQAGYGDGAHMAKDADLDPVRGRADFKAIVASLGPAPIQLGPPPREAKPRP